MLSWSGAWKNWKGLLKPGPEEVHLEEESKSFMTGCQGKRKTKTQCHLKFGGQKRVNKVWITVKEHHVRLLIHHL